MEASTDSEYLPIPRPPKPPSLLRHKVRRRRAPKAIEGTAEQVVQKTPEEIIERDALVDVETTMYIRRMRTFTATAVKLRKALAAGIKALRPLNVALENYRANVMMAVSSLSGRVPAPLPPHVVRELLQRYPPLPLQEPNEADAEDPRPSKKARVE